MKPVEPPVVDLLSFEPLAAQDTRPDSLVEAGFNIYQLSASSFLYWYSICALIIGLGAAMLARLSMQRARATAAPSRAGKPDVIEVAFLAGGGRQAVMTAVLWLVDRGHARIEGTKLIAESKPPDSAPPLVRAIARRGTLRAGVLLAQRGLGAEISNIHRTLVERGLIVAKSARPWWLLMIALSAPLFLALPRILAAHAAGRPYRFLVVLLVFATGIGAVLTGIFVLGRQRTTRGAILLDSLGSSSETRATAFPDESPSVAAAAAFGLTAISASEFGDVADFIDSGLPRWSGGAGCDGGGGSGGGCGGGGCGGGGCGG